MTFDGGFSGKTLETLAVSLTTEPGWQRLSAGW